MSSIIHMFLEEIFSVCSCAHAPPVENFDFQEGSRWSSVRRRIDTVAISVKMQLIYPTADNSEFGKHRYVA